MDKVEVDLDVGFEGDTPFVLVEEEKKQDIMSAIRKAEADIQILFNERNNVNNKSEAIAFAEYALYLENIVCDIKENLETLYDMRDKIESSPIDVSGEMADLIQANIDDLWLTADRFYALFGDYMNFNLLDFEKEVNDREVRKYMVESWIDDDDLLLETKDLSDEVIGDY